MGYAIADAALEAGHDVILISGPVNLAPPSNAKASPTKIKKRDERFSLELVRTRDILESLGQQRDRPFLLVGFAAETNDMEKNAAKKLREKNCDLIIANDVSSTISGMESDLNEVMILFQNGERQKISRTSKKIIARGLVKIFANSATKMFDKKNVTITERN